MCSPLPAAKKFRAAASKAAFVTGTRDLAARMFAAAIALKSPTSRPNDGYDTWTRSTSTTGLEKPAEFQQRSEHRRLDPRVDMGNRDAADRIGGPHRGAQLRQGVAARYGADQERVRRHAGAQAPKRAGQIVDGVERAERDDEVVSARPRLPRVFDDCHAAEQRRRTAGRGPPPLRPPPRCAAARTDRGNR